MTTMRPILLTLILIFAGCSASRPPDANSDALREISTVRLQTTNGAAQRLADYRGNVVMLHFFSSWCRECGMEAPTLRNLHTSFNGSPFSIVAVAVDDEPYNALAFASKHQLPFPILLDAQGDLKEFFSIKELPSTLFLSKQGVPIRFFDPQTGSQASLITGARQWDTEQPVQLIASLLESNR